MSIILGGTVAIDHIKTPTAEAANLLGGSVSYAALAASFYQPHTHLVGIVGRDFPEAYLSMFESRGISLVGLERSEGQSFTWSGEYHANMNDRSTLKVDINVLENWSVKVPATIADASIVVLANMSPENQLQMLDQCVAADRFVIADTMDLWIHIANERLHEVLKRIDLLVLNEGEARELAGTSDLIEAGRKLLAKGPKFVVVKLGEFGSMLFSAAALTSPLSPQNFFRCAAVPLERVADPTGAGDSFLGALAGYLSTTETTTYSFDHIRRAMVEGAVMASFTCEAFSTQKLEQIEPADIEARRNFLRDLTNWH